MATKARNATEQQQEESLWGSPWEELDESEEWEEWEEWETVSESEELSVDGSGEPGMEPGGDVVGDECGEEAEGDGRRTFPGAFPFPRPGQDELLFPLSDPIGGG